MFNLVAPVWVYHNRTSWVTVDGRIQHRALGAVIGGSTDPDVDPYFDTNADGYPSNYWWDGCHPLLFRPDR